MIRFVGMAAAVLLSGVAGALYQASRVEPRLAPADAVAGSPVEPGRSAPPPAPIDDRQLDALADRIASRVSARQGLAAPPAPVEPKAVPAPEATPQQRAAAGRAGDIVDRALSRGSLSPDDVRALRELGPQLQPAVQEALRMKLIQALNRQELRLDPRAGLP
ncbi:MAG TPA: hypothetical protein VLW85_14925 [Myxococcales bacterium]|nr:hypothetical protein [Myxococcales bacterium]